MKRSALIGLGTISRYYKKGLENSPVFRLVATADLSEKASARELYNDYPFYLDYTQMAQEQKPDYALIATPPKTHFEIAEYFLSRGVSVIVEKPAVLSLADYDKLTALAKANGAYFTVMFHWQYGSELAYYLRKFGDKPIQDIQVKICDNYGVGGVIREEKRPLSGAWLDSGVNALSMLARLLDFSFAQILYTEKETCRESGLPLYCKVGLQIGKTKTEIVVDWREDKDDKDSRLTVDNEKVWINHTKERVISEVESVECMQMPRLESHYYNYFTTFEEGETPQGRRTHELLFAVNERL